MPDRTEPRPGPALAPPITSRREAGRRRIVIVSASVGAGHDGAAAGLAERLAAHGYLVQSQDFLGLLPAGAGRLLCGGYHRLLTWAPEGYQHLYENTDRTARPGRVWRALFRSAERRMLRRFPPTLRALPPILDTCHERGWQVGPLRDHGVPGMPGN